MEKLYKISKIAHCSTFCPIQISTYWRQAFILFTRSIINEIYVIFKIVYIELFATQKNYETKTLLTNIF